MDFFAHQDHARKKTKLLVFYYILAIVLTNLAIYALFLVIFVLSQQSDGHSAPDPVSLINLPLLFFSTVGSLCVIGGGSLFKTIQLSSGGGKTIAELLGGSRVPPNTTDPAERRLLNVVEEIAIASGVQVPAVYVLQNDRGINAFAAGFTENEAVIGVTRGTMELLDRDEIQGVIAHEFSHILNGDMRLNIRLIGVLFGLQVVAWIGWVLLRSAGSGRSSSNDKNSGGAVLLVLGIGLAVIGAIGVFFGSLIKAAISRQREYLADASAVQFTRNPQGIAGALKKIGAVHIGSEVSSSHAMEASHLFLATPARFSIMNLFSTHPPLVDRIKRIDPTFDGKFEQRLQNAVNYYDYKDSLAQNEAKQQATQSRQKDFLKTTITMTAASLVDSIGQLTLNKLSIAKELIAEMPDVLVQKAHDVPGAQALIYAFLLADDELIRKNQSEMLTGRMDPSLMQTIREILPLLVDVPVQARYPLLELVLPTLKMLSAGEYRSFRDNVIVLVNADQKIDLFEYTTQAKLLRELDVHFKLAKPPVIKYYSIASVKTDHAIVLAYLAYQGHDTPDEAKTAFDIGMTAIQLSGDMPAQSDCTSAAFDTALKKLNFVSPPVKQKIIKSFAACVAADNKITIKEGELLRAITAMLGCPMPPLS